MRLDRPIVLFILASALVFLFTGAIYAAGATGGFVFDDWGNLPALGAQGPISNSASFLRYITAGTADPTGRPLSLLSFLIDGHDWPTAPLPFKRTNILLHLFNGALLAALLWRLGDAMGIHRPRRAFAAWFGSATWLLHPLFVSTTLYVVQREAMLTGTFMLLGMHAWLSTRRQACNGSGGIASIACTLFAFTILAFLSKANGILLPFLVCITEACLPTVEQHADRYRRRLFIACAPWVAAVVLGLAWYAVHGIENASAEFRGWTIGQRLMTEPTVLWIYLGQLFLFVPVTGSVFHDQYTAATDWLHPWWTLPAAMSMVVMIMLAWRCRRRYAAPALAVLFFVVGHLVESTSLPLELYFEHRNYVPAFLLFWPIGLALGAVGRRNLIAAASILVLAGAGSITWSLTRLWSAPVLQAITWANQAPDSARAQAYAAQMDAAGGHTQRAIDRLAPRIHDFQAEPQVMLTMLSLKCSNATIRPEDVDRARYSLEHTPRDPGKLLLNWVTASLQETRLRPCQGLDHAALASILDAASTNPRINALPGRQQDIEHARGALALADGNATVARMHFDKALTLDPRPEPALEQAAMLGQAGAPHLAVGHLDYYDTLPQPQPRGISAGMAWIHDKVLAHQHYWEKEFSHLRSVLVHDEKRHNE
ncbi:tetratricopeptide repeat protein [Luteibacter aegosomaticola]|uniref:tetratricopeptide repeat protein n=1 Tax=Luteibacter aegosomaticola TaxID=2911538 RepID=UPI001FF87ADC|nr:tetratricopeptide repeat protein [Luteibacter aegosomaticola]UPG91445.1 tetratricopeptide repeat protein [Luteibacter aegosomaticola]